MKRVYLVVMVLLSFQVVFSQAYAVDVDCTSKSLQSAIYDASSGDVLNVTGTCNESITITKNDLTIIGNNAVISGSALPFPMNLLTVDGAKRVYISGFKIEYGLFGMSIVNGASVHVSNTNIVDNIIGINVNGNAQIKLRDVDITDNGPHKMAVGLEVNDNSVVQVAGTVSISGCDAFGFDILVSSILSLEEERDHSLPGAALNSFDNLLGGQISVNSSFFARDRATVNVYNNGALGFSVNTGSTAMLFNATLKSHDNGLDGVDIVSAGNFELDGHSSIMSMNNGREGISVDDSTINLFGFFSTKKGLPELVVKGNAKDGIQLETGSLLDIGRNASVVSMNNGQAGLSLDDGSRAILQRAVMQNNAGDLRPNNRDEDNADIIATFGSRITFRMNPDNSGNTTANKVGLALCDASSMARGDVKCRKG
ncbi:MAG: hypothetical protein R3240_06220 [Gammaproteobacteria bacterium]|nr:hypothetical protein [Gammaproteobacteria bacterium]